MKSTLLLAFITIVTIQGCSVNETPQNVVDNDTISEVFEFSNINFVPNNYSVILDYPHDIYSSDMVLVYRLSGIFQGEDIWKLQPESFFFDDGTLDLQYNFNFTRYDTEVYMEGFDLATVSESFRLNQIFRVVIVPGYFGNKRSVNFKDYKAVVKALNIDESKVQKIQ